jgi:hypothetical protein
VSAGRIDFRDLRVRLFAVRINEPLKVELFKNLKRGATGRDNAKEYIVEGDSIYSIVPRPSNVKLGISVISPGNRRSKNSS